MRASDEGVERCERELDTWRVDKATVTTVVTGAVGTQGRCVRCGALHRRIPSRSPPALPIPLF